MSTTTHCCCVCTARSSNGDENTRTHNRVVQIIRYLQYLRCPQKVGRSKISIKLSSTALQVLNKAYNIRLRLLAGLVAKMNQPRPPALYTAVAPNTKTKRPLCSFFAPTLSQKMGRGVRAARRVAPPFASAKAWVKKQDTHMIALGQHAPCLVTPAVAGASLAVFRPGRGERGKQADRCHWGELR